MLRIALVLSLILSLLSCPINCMAGEDVSDPAQPAGCRCCQRHHREQPEAPEHPADPEDDCQCGNCLCHGAVRSDEDLLANVGSEFAIVQPMLPAAETSLAFCEARTALLPACPLDSGPSGSALRIWQQSFLL